MLADESKNQCVIVWSVSYKDTQWERQVRCGVDTGAAYKGLDGGSICKSML